MDDNATGVKRCQLVEIIVPGVAGTGQTGTTFTFPDQPMLRDKLIVAIESYTATDLAKGPSGNTTISGAQMIQTVITLVDNQSLEYIKQLPLVDTHRIQNSTPDPFVRHAFPICPRITDFSKCYATLMTAYGNTTTVSIILMIYFKDQPKAQK